MELVFDDMGGGVELDHIRKLFDGDNIKPSGWITRSEGSRRRD